MSVAENIYLGSCRPGAASLIGEKLYQDAARQLARLGMDVSPRPLAYSVPGSVADGGDRQGSDPGRQRHRFDEPTSSLSSREIEQLFRVIRQLQDEGKVILYVSHRMDEIFALCDAITVFSDGQFVRTFASHGRGGPICWSRPWWKSERPTSMATA